MKINESTLEEMLYAMKTDQIVVGSQQISSCYCNNDPDYHNKVFWNGGTNSKDAYYCSYRTNTIYEDREVPDIEKRVFAIQELAPFVTANKRLRKKLFRKVLFAGREEQSAAAAVLGYEWVDRYNSLVTLLTVTVILATLAAGGEYLYSGYQSRIAEQQRKAAYTKSLNIPHWRR
jgi:hypothetical protein